VRNPAPPTLPKSSTSDPRVTVNAPELPDVPADQPHLDTGVARQPGVEPFRQVESHEIRPAARVAREFGDDVTEFAGRTDFWGVRPR
jgi:hypothetical protein